MRQLSQLEKRLLRIYAVEKQMDSLGAIGDLEKTVNSISNVTKQLKETTQELFVYVGNILQKVFKPLLTNILGVTLALKDMSKSLANSLGAITKEYENNSANKLFGSIEEGAEDATESVNGLLGLLSFDKFEALSKSNEQTDDLEKIVSALALYETNFANIKSRAREIADSILEWLGYLPQVNQETGDIDYKLKDGLTNLRLILVALESLIALGIYTSVSKLIVSLKTMIINLIAVDKSLNKIRTTLSTISRLGVIVGITMIFEGLRSGNKVLIAIGASLTIIFGIIKSFPIATTIIKKISASLIGLNLLCSKLLTKVISIGIASAGIVSGTIIGFLAFTDKINAKTKMLIGTFGTLIGILMTLAGAYIAVQSAKAGVFAPGMIATIVGGISLGIGSMMALVKGIKQYKDGGIVEQGQMFIANEAGAELVGSFDGKTGVANNQMIVSAIEEASYRGFMRAMAQNENQTNINLNVQGVDSSAVARALFNPLIEEARRNGYNVSKS